MDALFNPNHRGTAQRVPRELSNRLAATLVTVFAAIGAALDLLWLGRPSFWYDEAVSAKFALMPIGEMLHALRHKDAFFGFYYLLLHAVATVSSSEFALRFPSVLAAVAFTFAVAHLARRLGSAKASVAAAFVASLSPLVTNAAKDARPYSLLLLLSTLMTLAFLQIVERGPSWSRYVAYAVLCIAGCYLHLFAFFVIVAHAVWSLAFRRELFGRGYTFALASIVVAIAPLVAVIHASGNVNSWITAPTMSTIPQFAMVFAGSKVLLVIEAALVIAAAVPLWRSRRMISEKAALLGLLLALPPILALGISLFRPVFVDRYLFEAYPAFVVIVAICLARLGLPFTVFAFSCIAAASIHPLARCYNDIENWRGAVSFVLHNERSGDLVVVYPGGEQISYDFYAGGKTSVPTISIAKTTARRIPPVPSAVIQDHRVWLITAELFNGRLNGGHRFITDALEKHDILAGDRAFAGDIHVMRFERRHY